MAPTLTDCRSAPTKLSYARGLSNLDDYWQRWVERARRGGLNTRGIPPRRLAASGVLGASRLHYTIATGGIASKEAAAYYALEVFEPRWHGLIEDALAFWRGEPPSVLYRRRPGSRRRDAYAFVVYVMGAANRLYGDAGPDPRAPAFPIGQPFERRWRRSR